MSDTGFAQRLFNDYIIQNSHSDFFNDYVLWILYLALAHSAKTIPPHFLVLRQPGLNGVNFGLSSDVYSASLCNSSLNENSQQMSEKLWTDWASQVQFPGKLTFFIPPLDFPRLCVVFPEPLCWIFRQPLIPLQYCTLLSNQRYVLDFPTRSAPDNLSPFLVPRPKSLKFPFYRSPEVVNSGSALHLMFEKAHCKLQVV